MGESLLRPVNLYTWTCVWGNGALVESESEAIQKRFETREGLEQLSRLLGDLSTKFGYEEFEVHGDIVVAPYRGFTEVELERIRPYFTRLRVGQLRKRVSEPWIENTSLQAYLCYSTKTKVTVFSSTNLDTDSEGAVAIKDTVLALEKNVGDFLFDKIYDGTPIKRSDYGAIVIYEVPNFSHIGELPVQDYGKPPNKELADQFRDKLLGTLKKKFPSSYSDCITLLTGRPEKKLEDVFLFPIPTVKGSSLLATCDKYDKGHVIYYGISSSTPWDACLPHLTNAILTME